MPAALSEEEGGQQSMNTAFQKRLRRMSKSIMERSIEFPEMGPGIQSRQKNHHRDEDCEGDLGQI